MTFSKILWYVINNGSLVDSRASGSEFRTMQQLVLLLVDIVLPTGQPPTYVMEDLSTDTQVCVCLIFYDDKSMGTHNFELNFMQLPPSPVSLSVISQLSSQSKTLYCTYSEGLFMHAFVTISSSFLILFLFFLYFFYSIIYDSFFVALKLQTCEKVYSL